MKPISHLPRPIGLLAALLSALLLVRRDDVSSASQPTITFVGTFAEADDPSFARFRTALGSAWPTRLLPPTLRYYEGGNLDEARLHRAVSVAAAERPTVLVLPTGDSAALAASLQHDASIVFASYLDPVRKGIVDAVRRPGRRTTGISLADNLDLKRLELLKDAFPRTRTVAMLADSSWLADHDADQLAADAASRLGLRLLVRQADTPEALEALLASPLASACDAWYIPPTYVAYLAETRIIAAMRQLRLPAIHADDGEFANGAQMAYSHDTRFTYDALAELARRVALGEDAGSIPIQRPYRYTLSVRIEPDAPWARIEPSVVRRADRVHRP